MLNNRKNGGGETLQRSKLTEWKRQLKKKEEQSKINENKPQLK